MTGILSDTKKRFDCLTVFVICLRKDSGNIRYMLILGIIMLKEYMSKMD